MRTSAILTVKGTKYYRATELFRRGSLSSGVIIHLEHQPNNPHDKNAVAVKIKRNGAMLGHVSKNLAPKYAVLIDEGRIVEASISRAEMNGACININVQVVYEQSDEQLSQIHNSRLWLSASSMPTDAGVYAIRNTNSGRQYIGSSTNLKSRLRSHIRQLSFGCHANHALQSDFSKLGAEYFEAEVLASGITSSALASVEAERITQLLNSGAALYNLTADGQGTGPNYRGHPLEPVSDRLARQRAEVERKAIIDAFEPRLAALLPQANFWAYFVVTFFCAFIGFATVLPKIKDGSLFVLSGVVAFVVSRFISVHFQEKAKQSVRYQSLVKQRNDQLEAINNKYRKM